MEYQILKDNYIVSNTENSVCEIQLNRPEKMNALTDDMYGELVRLLKLAETDDSIKSVIISSTNQHFTAGNDLADFLSTEFNVDSNVIQFLLTLATYTKPLIAAVNGAVVGVGTTMLLHCDYIFAANDSKFSLPFIKLGLTPEGGSSLLLAQRCGDIKANDWLLTGRNILADEALSAGLISSVYESTEATREAARELAGQLAKSSVESLVDSKRILRSHQKDLLVEVIKKEAMLFAKRLQSEEAQTALNAFLNR